MKTTYVATQRRLAKHWHRHAKTHYSRDGISIFYEFEDDQPLTWRTETAFVLNDYVVSVVFEHPRYVVWQQIKQLARVNVAHIQANDDWVDDWLNDVTPIIHRLGKSRKKIWGYHQNGPIGGGEWIHAYDAEITRLKAEANFLITLSIRVQWVENCRLATLCAPIEICNHDDLLAMAMLVKRILKQETSLEREFPGYVYRREDWLSDLKTDSKHA